MNRMSLHGCLFLSLVLAIAGSASGQAGEKGGDQDPKVTEADPAFRMIRAVRAGDMEELKSMLAKGYDVDLRNKLTGVTSLHMAATVNNVDMIEVLLEAGAEIDAKTKEGLTPLHLATGTNRVEAVKLLLEKGANIEAKDNRGNTPLHMTVLQGWDLTEYLLDKGADIQARCNGGLTPLHRAAMTGKKKTIVLLLKRGAKPDAKDDRGLTPLKMSQMYDVKKSVEILSDPEAAKKMTFDNAGHGHVHEYKLELDDEEVSTDDTVDDNKEEKKEEPKKPSP
jgi:ankyrin repeat protein